MQAYTVSMESLAREEARPGIVFQQALKGWELFCLRLNGGRDMGTTAVMVQPELVNLSPAARLEQYGSSGFDRLHVFSASVGELRQNEEERTRRSFAVAATRLAPQCVMPEKPEDPGALVFLNLSSGTARATVDMCQHVRTIAAVKVARPQAEKYGGRGDFLDQAFMVLEPGARLQLTLLSRRAPAGEQGYCIECNQGRLTVRSIQT